jgi:hypothetical protein
VDVTDDNQRGDAAAAVCTGATESPAASSAAKCRVTTSSSRPNVLGWLPFTDARTAPASPIRIERVSASRICCFSPALKSRALTIRPSTCTRIHASRRNSKATDKPARFAGVAAAGEGKTPERTEDVPAARGVFGAGTRVATPAASEGAASLTGVARYSHRRLPMLRPSPRQSPLQGHGPLNVDEACAN